MRVEIVTIFPEALAPLEVSILGRARARGLVEISVVDLRDFTSDRHRQVDDLAYGGGPGMVMKPEPFFAAVEALTRPGEGRPRVLLTTFPGEPHGLGLLMAEATLAVENPSQMLEDYPELDLSDFDPENEQQLEVLSRQLETLTTEPDYERDGRDESVELTPEAFNLSDLENRDIVLNQHCYGCTAGAGSSCQGTTT